MLGRERLDERADEDERGHRHPLGPQHQTEQEQHKDNSEPNYDAISTQSGTHDVRDSRRTRYPAGDEEAGGPLHVVTPLAIRLSIGTHVRSRGPEYSDCGRMMRFAFLCSKA